VLLGLVPASRHQPDLFAARSPGHQQLSPLVDRINRRYGRCTIGFGLFPSEVREFKSRCPQGKAAEKIVRAVNRIDDPAALASPPSALRSEKAILRRGLGQASADQGLD